MTILIRLLREQGVIICSLSSFLPIRVATNILRFFVSLESLVFITVSFIQFQKSDANSKNPYIAGYPKYIQIELYREVQASLILTYHGRRSLLRKGAHLRTN